MSKIQRIGLVWFLVGLQGSSLGEGGISKFGFILFMLIGGTMLVLDQDVWESAK